MYYQLFRIASGFDWNCEKLQNKEKNNREDHNNLPGLELHMEFFVGIYRFKIEGEHENGGIDDDPKSAKIICGSAAGVNAIALEKER